MYDPFGFLAPVMIVAKLILQELCMSHLDWDDLLPDEMYHRWTKWRHEVITEIENIKVNPELHQKPKPSPFQDWNLSLQLCPLVQAGW